MAALKVVILAGGQGARFWPISRIKRPKQFLSISESGESLIQATARRVLPLSGKENLMVVTNVLHEALIAEHVPYAQIVSEPIGRNTAASIGLAAIRIRRESPKTVMVVLPADHSVTNEDILRETLKEAAELAASKDILATIGIKPTFAHTGYGYIKRGKKIGARSYEVGRFYEKPNLERATKYIEAGDYFWNSGMFVWRAEVILAAIKDEMPNLFDALQQIEQALGSALEKETIQRVFNGLESTSIDFGVLEHAKNCAVVGAEAFGWSDVGSWDAWAEHFDKDADGNLRYGDALVIDSKGCVVHSKNRLIAVLGAEDLVVIDAGDAMLVCPRSRLQDVRKIVDELKREGRNEFI